MDNAEPLSNGMISRSRSRSRSQTRPMHWQVAPEYFSSSNSGSDSDSSSTAEEERDPEAKDGEYFSASARSPLEERAEEHEEKYEERDLDKIETQRDDMTAPIATRPTTLRKGRTRSSRREQEGPVGFWHFKMAGVRLHVLKLWLRTNLILAIAIMGLLCLFWGALFTQERLVHKLIIDVVDFDGKLPPFEGVEPVVGPFVVESVQRLLDSGTPQPGYKFRSPAYFDNDPMRVRESVYDFHAWAAVIINPNATALLQAAVREGNSSYDPAGACQIIYNTARDSTTVPTHIVPSLVALQQIVGANFGREWINHLLQDSNSSSWNLTAAPQAISPGIDFTTYDLRPFSPPVATPAVSIGLIYLIIVSFFSFTFFLPIHHKFISPRGHPPLHFHHLILWRYTATVLSYFMLSCVYSLVSLAFQVPMTRPPASHTEPALNPNAYSHGTFVVYWMLNFVGMTALGLASENMAMLLGTPWTALWLIFWVISNVATGFYALPLAAGWYRWGYAWPMHNIVEATRQILFDLHPRIGLNFGVLFVWCAIGTALFPCMCYYMRWNTMRAKRLAAKREAEWEAKMEKQITRPSLLARVTTLGERAQREKTRGEP